MSKVKSAYRILVERGIFGLYKSFINYVYKNKIRQYIPKGEKIVQNEVVLPDKKRILDSYFLENSKDVPNREDGIVSAHKAYTWLGDSVVIVGGGNGITGVRAAKIVGQEGCVLVFEGAKENAKKIEDTFYINDINASFKINHAVVGETIDVWGDAKGADKIRPHQLPSCDVLELDCEGSEVEVLEKMNITPRVLIME